MMVNTDYKKRNVSKKNRKLDMHKTPEFTYLTNKVLESLPENVRGSISGSIYAKASRLGINDAKEFILKKKQEGILTDPMAESLINLLFRYSKYR
ncbi:MAG: hypothetical protein ACP5RY_00410 [Thermoplasmata archaeon]